MQHKTNNIVDLIRNNVKLSQYIGQYITLTKRGSQFIGLCPFHAEKTPSFNVNDDKGFYHCFGCKESGTIVQFAQKYLHLEFKEAIQQTANFAGIILDKNTYQRYSEQEKLHKEIIDLNNQVALIYHQALRLPSCEGAQSYLKQREIQPELVTQFLLGASPKKYSFLSKKMDLAKFKEQTLSASQLFYGSLSDEAGLKDRFRDKVIFPIQNIEGDVIAFGSRVLDNSLPKYINSAETPIFSKKETLYGLYQAKNTIKEENLVYITEGYFDVIAMHQNGHKNAVATLGTAIGKQHIQILRHYTENIVLLFDGDLAGEKAAQKALFICLEEEITPKFVLCDPGKDPYDMAMYHREYLKQWITQKTKSWEEFLIYTLQKETDPIKQKKSMNSYLQSLEKITPFLRESFFQSVRTSLRAPQYKNALINKNQLSPVTEKNIPKIQPISPQEREKQMEILFVCLCLYVPEYFYQLQEKFHMSGAFFNHPNAKELFNLFILEKNFVLDIFFSTLPKFLKQVVTQHKKLISSMENKQKALLDCYYSIQISALQQQENNLKKNLNTSKNQESIVFIMQELQILNKKKKDFEQKIKTNS